MSWTELGTGTLGALVTCLLSMPAPQGPAARGRADAPRQLLRVSRPSTTTSLPPAGLPRLCAQVPSPLSPRFCRASRSQVPSSPRRLARSYLVRVMSRSLLIFFLVVDGVRPSCSTQMCRTVERRRPQLAARDASSGCSLGCRGQARRERHQRRLGRSEQIIIIVICTCSIALVPAVRARRILI